MDREFLKKLKNSDILAITETHTQNKDISIPGYTLVKEKIRVKQHKGPKISGGLAVFVKDYLYRSIHVVPNTNENTIWIKMKPKDTKINTDIYIGFFYVSPDNTLKHKRKTDLFELLVEETNRFKEKGAILINGDLNARVGQNDDFVKHDKFDVNFNLENMYNLPLRNSKDTATNARGNDLLDFCKVNDYIIINGRKVGDIFGKHTSHQWNGSSLVDYLITPNKDYDKIDSFSVGEYSPWLSDHCPIYTEITTNTPKQKGLETTVKLHHREPGYIWNENVKDAFHTHLNSDTVKRKLENLLNSTQMDPTHTAEEIKNTLLDTAKECNMRKIKSKSVENQMPWFDTECLNIKNKIHHLGKKLKETPEDKGIRTELFTQKRSIKKLVRKKKRQHRQKIINEMENNKNKDPKIFWKLTKKLKKLNKCNTQYVSHDNLYKHFKSVLTSNRKVNIPPDNPEKGKLDHPFTTEELQKARRILKNGKATGADNLNNEMISSFTEMYPLLSIKLFNDILDSNKPIPDWTIGMITAIFKKGSKTDPSNYRGISLLSCFGKLFTTLLNNRLLEFANENNIISPNQLGFLPGNRTSDAHLIIHNIIQRQCHKNKKRLYSCFIDFSKAFDTIPRDKLLIKLLDYDIKGKFFNTIKNIYINDKACLKINDKITDTFEVNQGVKQGCVLSPLLFNIYMADLPKIFDEDLITTHPTTKHPSCLIWADDIITLSETEEGLNKMLNSLAKYCEENELVVNIDKTKCMICNKSGKLIRRNFYFNGIKIETVRSFKYLGLVLTPSGEIRSALNDLRDRAMKAFFKLKNSMGEVFHTHITTTLHLLDTLIKPIILYASDFWGCLKLPKDNPIEKFHHMACKHILGVQKHTTNLGVLLELGRVPLQTYAIKAAIQNWERIKSKQVNAHLKASYENAIEDNLPWISNIKHTLDKNGMTCFYMNSYNDKPPFIHKKISQKISDIFHQEAFSTITNEQSKLRTYGILKKEIGFERYLHEIKNPSIRKSVTKLRLSNHSLNIEIGRYKKLHKQQRFCPFCPSDIETEIHFLIECNTYDTIRRETIQEIIQNKPNFTYYTPTEKFKLLLSKENIYRMSKYIHNCFEIRSFLTSNPKQHI